MPLRKVLTPQEIQKAVHLEVDFVPLTEVAKILTAHRLKIFCLEKGWDVACFDALDEINQNRPPMQGIHKTLLQMKPFVPKGTLVTSLRSCIIQVRTLRRTARRKEWQAYKRIYTLMRHQTSASAKLVSGRTDVKSDE